MLIHCDGRDTFAASCDPQAEFVAYVPRNTQAEHSRLRNEYYEFALPRIYLIRNIPSPRVVFLDLLSTAVRI